MSPGLQNLVTLAGPIQRQTGDLQRRILAWLLTAYGNAALGQTPVVSMPFALPFSATTAQMVASKFQGLTDEFFNDLLTYALANAINTNGVAGQVAAGVVPTDGFALNTLVTNTWGGTNGVVNAEVVNRLIQYGLLSQLGLPLQNI